jgi:hypothetical protein
LPGQVSESPEIWIRDPIGVPRCSHQSEAPYTISDTQYGLNTLLNVYLMRLIKYQQFYVSIELGLTFRLINVRLTINLISSFVSIINRGMKKLYVSSLVDYETAFVSEIVLDEFFRSILSSF